MKEFEHYIRKRIQMIYRKRLIFPLLFLALIALLLFCFDIPSIVYPEAYSDSETQDYVTAEFRELRFTGYTESILGRTNGYYYYTVKNGDFCLVLLSPRTCEEGLPYMENVVVRCEVLDCTPTQAEVLSRIAEDLGWTRDGILFESASYYFDEPDYHYSAGVALLLFLILFGAYAIYDLISSLIYIRFPHLSPQIRQLSRFGNAKEMLKEAEEELLTLPQLATEDLFITEHYFIEVTDRTVAVVPIREIIWVYKHSTLHKFLWYHFSISYTLSLTANKHIYIQCPKNIKSDIDGIIDYLAEANHRILVGFSEANRLKVQEIQGTPLQLDKLLAFFNQRV